MTPTHVQETPGASGTLGLITPRRWKRVMPRRRRRSRTAASPWLIPALYASVAMAGGMLLNHLSASPLNSFRKH